MAVAKKMQQPLGLCIVPGKEVWGGGSGVYGVDRSAWEKNDGGGMKAERTRWAKVPEKK